MSTGHPRDAEKVSVTGAGSLRECKNTEFAWELRKTGFCEGGCKESWPHTGILKYRVCMGVEKNGVL